MLKRLVTLLVVLGIFALADAQKAQSDLLATIPAEVSRATSDVARLGSERGPVQQALEEQRGRASRHLDELVASSGSL